MIRWIHSILGGIQGQHFGLQIFFQSNYPLFACKIACILRKQVLHFAYKSCISFTKLAFYLQIVHFRLQTCVSITKVAFRFTNATFRITIELYEIQNLLFLFDFLKILRKNADIAPNTMTKLRRDEPVSMLILLKIAEYLECDISDMCEFVKEEK